MTKALLWVIGALLILVAVATRDARGARAERDVAKREVEDAQIDKRRWQAKYAIQSIELQRVDTVFRVAKARVDSIRDTLVISDTVMVREYVERTDAALQACTELANSCQVFRVTADSTLAAERKVNDALRQYAESVKPSLIQKHWWAAAITGVVIGAWVRGSP